MTSVIRQGFLRGMASVGLVLIVALLSGKGHPQSLGLYLGVFGVLLLLQTALPALRSQPGARRREPEQQAREEDTDRSPSKPAGPAKRQPSARERSAGCARGRQESLRQLVFRGLFASGIVLGMAALIYYVAPIAA